MLLLLLIQRLPQLLLPNWPIKTIISHFQQPLFSPSATTSAAGKVRHTEQLYQATAIASADSVRSSDVASDQSAEMLKMLVNAVLQMDARMKSMEDTLDKIVLYA